jgi:hypothetical protein
VGLARCLGLEGDRLYGSSAFLRRGPPLPHGWPGLMSSAFVCLIAPRATCSGTARDLSDEGVPQCRSSM